MKKHITGTRKESDSTYARGVNGLWGTFQWLDCAPKGRSETSAWWRRHDEYNWGAKS